MEVGDGGEGGRGVTPVPVLVPVVSKIQVEYSKGSCILGVFWLYELEYNYTIWAASDKYYPPGHDLFESAVLPSLWF